MGLFLITYIISAYQLASRGRPGVNLTPFRANSLNSNPKSQFDSPSRRLISCFRCIFFPSFFFLFPFSNLNFILLACVSLTRVVFHRVEKSSIAFRSSHRVQNGKETSGFQDRPQTSLSGEEFLQILSKVKKANAPL